MSAGGATGGSLRRWATGAGLLALAAALGFPVEYWAAGLAVVLTSVACIAHILGFAEAAKGLTKPLVTSVAVALATPMLRHMARTVIADPAVQHLAMAVAAIAVVGGGLLLLAKAMAHPAEKHAAHRPSFRRRAIVRNPEPLATPEAPATRRAPQRDHESDDLGLLDGGGPRGRR